MPLKERLIRLLRWSEKYTRTDMVYLFTNSAWMQSGSFFVSFASFLLYVVFGHFLPKEVYGTYQYLLSLGAIVAACTLTGMTTSVARAVARGYEGTYRASIRVQLAWGLLPLAGSWTAGAYYFLHGNTTLGWGLALIGVFIPLSTTFNTYGGYLSGKRDFKGGFISSLIVNIPYYCAVALAAVSLPAALAVLAAYLVSQALGHWVAHRRVLAQYKPNDAQDPEAIRYGMHLSLMNVLSMVVAQVDSILVFHYLGAAELALWSFATAVPGRLSIFGTLAGAAFPKYAQRTPGHVDPSIGRKLFISIGAALAIALIYTLLAHPFFALFFPKYLDSVPYSQAYAFIVATSFSAVFVTMLTAQGRVRRLYAYNIAAPLILLISEVIGLTTWGLWGLVWAVLGANLATSLLSMLLALYGGKKREGTVRDLGHIDAV